MLRSANSISKAAAKTDTSGTYKQLWERTQNTQYVRLQVHAGACYGTHLARSTGARSSVPSACSTNKQQALSPESIAQRIPSATRCWQTPISFAHVNIATPRVPNNTTTTNRHVRCCKHPPPTVPCSLSPLPSFPLSPWAPSSLPPSCPHPPHAAPRLDLGIRPATPSCPPAPLPAAPPPAPTAPCCPSPP